jgi:hypothetical protein
VRIAENFDGLINKEVNMDSIMFDVDTSFETLFGRVCRIQTILVSSRSISIRIKEI